eukprot:4632401-Amphidinium_carterae.1
MTAHCQWNIKVSCCQHTSDRRNSIASSVARPCTRASCINLVLRCDDCQWESGHGVRNLNMLRVSCEISWVSIGSNVCSRSPSIHLDKGPVKAWLKCPSFKAKYICWKEMPCTSVSARIKTSSVKELFREALGDTLEVQR